MKTVSYCFNILIVIKLILNKPSPFPGKGCKYTNNHRNTKINYTSCAVFLKFEPGVQSEKIIVDIQCITKLSAHLPGFKMPKCAN